MILPAATTWITIGVLDSSILEMATSIFWRSTYTTDSPWSSTPKRRRTSLFVSSTILLTASRASLGDKPLRTTACANNWSTWNKIVPSLRWIIPVFNSSCVFCKSAICFSILARVASKAANFLEASS